MIIDAHTHIFIQHPFPDNEASSFYPGGIKRDSLKDYLESFDYNGVDACYVFPPLYTLESRFEFYNEELAKIAAMRPDRLYPWAIVCPTWPEKKLRSEMRRAVKELGMYGFKFVPIMQGFSLQSIGMHIVAEEAIDMGVPVVFHDGSPQYCSAIQVAHYARKYPGLKVLSGHGGLREMWSEFIQSAKELPNLYICLSGPPQWGMQQLYNELGPEKLLFGSDGGTGHPAGITAYLRRIRKMDVPEEHKKMILGTNALRFLNIKA